MRKLASLPVAAASSAYQICLVLLFRVLMTGMVARACMGMASGSPCVIPSWESRMSPSTVGARYVLMSMVASGEQSLLMFWRATWRFRELKASTRRTASVSNAVLTACTAASIPAICPPHIWRQPEASWMSGFASDITALAIIRRPVSPMPIGRTPGFLSRAMSRQARKGERDFGSTYRVHILLATSAKE